MRSVLLGLMATTVVACGVFGSTDDAPAKEDPGLPPPSTPQDNSTPPPAVGGEAPVGVYVSSSQGQDDGSGSAVRPLKTLARAFALAKEKGLRVIACAEEYAENVTLIDGVSAYGYYDCKKTPWERGAPRAIVRAPASPAVIAKGITQPTRLEGFEVRSPDLDGTPATDTEGTSIALEVRGSNGLTVSEVLLHAGKGAPGTDGVEGPLNSRTATSNGTAAVDQHTTLCPAFLEASGKCGTIKVPGPAGGVTTCAIGPAGGPGGQGGDGRIYVINKQPGTELGEQHGRPLVGTTSTGVGAANANPSALGIGAAALRGANGTEGTDGQNGTWSLAASGFVRGNGTQGGAGGPGQGGGGGAGTGAGFQSNGAVGFPVGLLNTDYFATATGGGGAGGGCGGQAGTPATGGGASVGALVIDSVVTFERSRIESSSGGKAGKGNLGTSGTTGGTGGDGAVQTISVTGKGGDGGPGGNGGASGHGAPGPSIALAYSTKKPTLTAVDLAPGPAGAGQPQLSKLVGGTVGTKLLPAATGESTAEYAITQ